MRADRSIKDFLGEAEDILESANSALVTLESEQASGRVNPEPLNALFRAVHSLKGLAGMFGLTALAELTHKMEFLLDELRLGKIALSQDVLDVLFDTSSLLGRLVGQTGKRQPAEDTGAALDRLENVLRVRSGAAMPSDRTALDRIDIDADILGVLTEYEEYRLQENIRERANFFLVKAGFDLSDFEVGIKRLTDDLKRAGEVICTLPTAGTKEGGIGFTLLVAMRGGLEDLGAAVAGANVSVRPVSYRESAPVEAPKLEAGSIRSVSNTVRVDIHRLDSLMNSVGELHLTKNVIGRIAKEMRAMQGFTGMAVNLHKEHRNLERKLNELQEGILAVRMVPLGQIFGRLTQAVRKYAKESGKDIEIELRGEETELDKLMIEDLADPLMHLIRNAVDHGIEPPDIRAQRGKPEQGMVRLTAFPKGNHVVITVEDDGAGISVPAVLAKAEQKGLVTTERRLDPVEDRKEILDLIFLPGFTTREAVTEISGRGVGMDVVKRNIAKLSGMIEIETEPGAGTKFVLTLPITLAIIKALIIEAGGQVFAVPLSSVLEILQVTADRIETIETREVMAIRGDTVPLARLARVFALPEQEDRSAFYVILVGMAERRLGILVEGLRDQQEIVIKPISKRFSDIPGIAGATELGHDRGVVLVLDVESLVEGSYRKVLPGARS